MIPTTKADVFCVDKSFKFTAYKVLVRLTTVKLKYNSDWLTSFKKQVIKLVL